MARSSCRFRLNRPFPASWQKWAMPTGFGIEQSFEWPAAWKNQRALLHLGAVDWDATVLVNGKQVGQHRGGYTPIDLDITDQLSPTGPQELVVSVWDPTDAGAQPRGKQVARPNGIWYTAVTGIWQTVWIEPVPQVSIDSLLLVSDLDAGVLNITAKLAAKPMTPRFASSRGMVRSKLARRPARPDRQFVCRWPMPSRGPPIRRNFTN